MTTISRRALKDIAVLLNLVPEDVAELTIYPDRVSAVVYQRDENNKIFLDQKGYPAVSRLHMPVFDGVEDTE